MYPLLIASFNIIRRRFPNRMFLQQTSLQAAIGVYALTVIVGLLESVVSEEPLTESVTASIVGSIIMSLAAIVVFLAVGRWIINWYVTNKFSYREFFVLEVLLTGATQIIFGLLTTGGMLLGVGTAMIVSVLVLVFAIYMLLTFQQAVSQIASITKSQAAHVILGPVIAILLVWFAFGSLVLGSLAVI